jgi:hypothetical protein
MKNQFFSFSLLGLTVATIFLMVSCNPKPSNVNEVVLGELRDGTPQLTYSNLPKLKKALQLAFSAGARIDTIFLHSEKETQNDGVIMLTAIAKESDSIYTSVNFQIRIPNGKPITWVPVGDARWCTGKCTSGCYSTKTSCICQSGTCSDMPIVVGGVNRPIDLSEIIIPYLAQR